MKNSLPCRFSLVAIIILALVWPRISCWGQKAEAIYRVSDFGAIGDGVADDSASVQAAINAAIGSKGPAVVEFDRNKEYAFESLGKPAPGAMYGALSLVNASDITLRGNGARISVHAKSGILLRTLIVFDSRNVHIHDLTFSYVPKPFVSVTVESVDVSDTPSMIVTSPTALDFPGNSWRPNQDFGLSYFGLEDCPERLHIFLTGYERLPDNKYRVGVNTKRDSHWKERLERLPGRKFLTPNPVNGHLSIAAYVIMRSSHISMTNCEIENAPFFLFNIRYNTGPLTFTRVNIRPRPGSADSMVGWRDGYHCKDNRGAIAWTDCVAQGLHDDIFNIAATTLEVKDVIARENQPAEYRLKSNEVSSGKLQAGDVISIIDSRTGEDFGDAVLASVKDNYAVTLDRPLPRIKPGATVAVKSLTAPGSQIQNCHFTGTFRFKGNLTVVNTTFDVMRIWFNNEIVIRLSPDRTVTHSLFVEGPMPFDQLYKNCTFNGVIPDAEIVANSFMEKTGRPQYRARNILFASCHFNRINLNIEPGQDLIFEK